LAKRPIIIAVERYRRLELDPRFGQSVLIPAEHPHCIVRYRAVRIALESFGEQLSGSR